MLLDLRMLGHGVSRVVQGLDNGIDRRAFVIELHADGVGEHVGLDGFDGTHFLDGRTGLRGSTASDDSGGLQDVVHVRGPRRPCDE